MLSDLTLFRQYTDVSGGSDALMSMYLQSAEDIVSAYLGFSLEEAEYSETYRGDGLGFIRLSANNVSNVILVVDTSATDPSVYRIQGSYLILNDPFSIFAKDSVIAVTYTGGYTSANVPSIIQNVIFEIATLKASEEASKLSVTSYSFGEMGGSRQYQDTTSFNKFLRQINQYRLFRL